jgi:hypothetical protein
MVGQKRDPVRGGFFRQNREPEQASGGGAQGLGTKGVRSSAAVKDRPHAGRLGHAQHSAYVVGKLKPVQKKKQRIGISPQGRHVENGPFRQGDQSRGRLQIRNKIHDLRGERRAFRSAFSELVNKRMVFQGPGESESGNLPRGLKKLSDQLRSLYKEGTTVTPVTDVAQPFHKGVSAGLNKIH